MCAVSESEESLVRLVESPATEPQPTMAVDTSTQPSLRFQLISCQSCNDATSQLASCGYYLALSGTELSLSPQLREHAVTSSDSTDDASSSDVGSSLDLTTETQSETLTAGADVIATETVVKPTVTDAELVSAESQTQSSVVDDTPSRQLSSSLPGTSLFDLVELIIN